MCGFFPAGNNTLPVPVPVPVPSHSAFASAIPLLISLTTGDFP
ncbi:hypothetical protein LTSEURB_6668, partial [Salmonella enterica subsp. enterica serovar Urbana str. R8-2977]